MKKILSLVLIFAMMLSYGVVNANVPLASYTLTFNDVDANSAQGEAILKLVEMGILAGYGDGTFRPDNFLTRAELCKIINLAFNYTEKAEEGFSDVKSDDWFYDYALVAKKAGYITGYEDGTFRGNNQLTRQEACAIISRVANLKDVTFTDKITDKVDEWAVLYVNKVLGNKIMSLEANGTFRATEKITRGELVSVVYVTINNSTKPSTPSTPSTPTTPSRPSTPTTPSTPSAKPSTKPEIDEDKQEEMVDNIKLLVDDIETNLKRFTPDEKEILNIIKDAMEDTLKDAKKDIAIYEENYVTKTYKKDINNAKAKYDAMSEVDKGGFRNRIITYLSTYVIEELSNTLFGMSIEDLIESQKD